MVALWGPNPLPLPKPASFRGSIILGGAAIEKYRMIAVALGLAVYVALHLVLNRTRIGLLVRAGVENREMVEAFGYASAGSSSACSSPARRSPGWAG